MPFKALRYDCYLEEDRPGCYCIQPARADEFGTGVREKETERENTREKESAREGASEGGRE